MGCMDAAAPPPDEESGAGTSDGDEATGGGTGAPEEEVLELEVLDAVPLPEPVPESMSLQPATTVTPALQTAAAAATGFLAGAAALALLRRGGARRLSRELAELRELRETLQAGRRSDPFAMIPGRSYLFHVRVLSRPPGRPGEFSPHPPAPPVE